MQTHVTSKVPKTRFEFAMKLKYVIGYIYIYITYKVANIGATVLGIKLSGNE